MPRPEELELEAEVVRLRKLLRKVEWHQPMHNGSRACPSCGAQQHWGHYDDCELKLVLEEDNT